MIMYFQIIEQPYAKSCKLICHMDKNDYQYLIGIDSVITYKVSFNEKSCSQNLQHLVIKYKSPDQLLIKIILFLLYVINWCIFYPGLQIMNPNYHHHKDMSDDQYARQQALNSTLISERRNPSMILNRRLQHMNKGNIQLPIGSNNYHNSLLFLNLFLYGWVACTSFIISIAHRMGDDFSIIIPIIFMLIGYFICICSGFRIYKVSYLNKIESAKNSRDLAQTYQRLLEDPGRMVVSLSRFYPMTSESIALESIVMHKQQFKLKPTRSQPINIQRYLQQVKLACIAFQFEPKHMDYLNKERIDRIVNDFRQENRHMIDASSIIQTKFQCGDMDLDIQNIYYNQQRPQTFYKIGFIIFAAVGLMWVFQLWTRYNIRIHKIKVPKDIDLE